MMRTMTRKISRTMTMARAQLGATAKARRAKMPLMPLMTAQALA
jgi:hypothetical protein